MNNSSDQYAIAYNGGLITRTNLHSLSEKTISNNQFLKANDFFKNKNVNLLALTKKDIYLTNPNINPYTSFISFKNFMPIHLLNPDKLINVKINFFKLLLAGKKEELDRLTPQFPKWFYKKFNLIRSEKVYIDIMAPNVNKGWAVNKLRSLLKIPSNQIMAIGNADNDIDMIKEADVGVAVANSSFNLKKNANVVTKRDNNHDAVGEAIRNWVL